MQGPSPTYVWAPALLVLPTPQAEEHAVAGPDLSAATEGGSQVRRCGWCKSDISTRNLDAVYCQDTCRVRAWKSRQPKRLAPGAAPIDAARTWIAQHPERWRDLMTEGLSHWRASHPEWRERLAAANRASVAKTSRPLTDQQNTELSRLRRRGLSWRAAARIIGISPSRAWRWMQRGNLARSPLDGTQFDSSRLARG